MQIALYILVTIADLRHFALKPLIFSNFMATIMSIKKRKNFLKLLFFLYFQ